MLSEAFAMCAVVRSVLHAVLTRGTTLVGALFDAKGMLDVPGPVAPLRTIDLLVHDRDLGGQPIWIRMEDGTVC